ncbi:hypothetical protein PHLGIDRAFT_98083 [Phlebiopsis gigantea 11061_1 CR5-6]|uniref:Ino eighty subunit 1 n=1 Tax=Phlebiopsis gigantea (strain 11061_1 CR5-6) TaxID=745531 RepID=A0A0C3SEC3_PHLG1|nr:hypothetical protein PHLGIDRAFT_98083 [Phlebiopsis gigantea 11061_1 CR5-6]
MASSSSADRAQQHPAGSSWHPQQVNTPPQYLGRKTLPIKRADAEPLTREDIQYDLLYFIFADPTQAFIDSMAPGQPLVNFCDLYVNALFNSSKCSKVLKDKMVDTPEFAIEFAKIALLTNVGRINTTMAFFPEMKTALRSYHPVPSLQKSDGNLQDAPRIKNCLKAALLPQEMKGGPPTTPQEIREKTRGGLLPPTSVVNLIFVLSNASHALHLAATHFEPPVEFLDLFLPINISSASRAQVFLWLVFHYLSAPGAENPFDDDYSREHPGKVPRMVSISREEQLRENQDPSEEIDWGKKMSQQRSKFLKELVDEMEAEKRRKKNAQMVPPVSVAFSQSGSRGSSYGHEVPPQAHGVQQPTPRHAQPAQTAGRCPHSVVHNTGKLTAKPQSKAETKSRRQIVQYAWHVVNTTDPLEDSDTEADEHVRLDYSEDAVRAQANYQFIYSLPRRR